MKDGLELGKNEGFILGTKVVELTLGLDEGLVLGLKDGLAVGTSDGLKLG